MSTSTPVALWLGVLQRTLPTCGVRWAIKWRWSPKTWSPASPASRWARLECRCFAQCWSLFLCPAHAESGWCLSDAALACAAFYYGWQMALLVLGIMPFLVVGVWLQTKFTAGAHNKVTHDAALPPIVQAPSQYVWAVTPHESTGKHRSSLMSHNAWCHADRIRVCQRECDCQ